MAPRPAVFLDRDGTINQERHYLSRSEEFELIPGVPRALKRLRDAGFLLVVVSNQSGVARGFFSLEDAWRINAHMSRQLARYGVAFDGIYLCPHHPTAGIGAFRRDCECRKGRPGMLLQAARELNIDLPRSYMIGDKLSDLQAGAAAGCSPLLVRTGFGAEQEVLATDLCDGIFDDLPRAVEYILNR
ncbi:MAG TPA: D-glycero-beta-D-manno-heptose 1,7-bisphosphate 7-phosphatase [Geopsychrobacteraceae bacterium]|jgi:D-glycero-D-manno-heptose 1,7-bisphosphate phosphatase